MSGFSTFRIPMHGKRGLVALEEILEDLDGTGLAWRVRDIQAISRQGAGLNVLQLEQEVRGRPDGVVLSDTGLRGLARRIFQVIDCEIVGFLAEQPDTSADEVSLVAFDSSEWIVGVSGPSCRRIGPSSPLRDQAG